MGAGERPGPQVFQQGVRAAETGNRASPVWENMAERGALSYCGSWYNIDLQGYFHLYFPIH